MNNSNDDAAAAVYRYIVGILCFYQSFETIHNMYNICTLKVLVYWFIVRKSTYTNIVLNIRQEI